MAIYETQVNGIGGKMGVEVHYRVRAWGVDLDEVYLAGTDIKVPLTATEYRRLAYEIAAHLASQRGKP